MKEIRKEKKEKNNNKKIPLRIGVSKIKGLAGCPVQDMNIIMKCCTRNEEES